MIRLTVAWSGKAKRMEAATKKTRKMLYDAIIFISRWETYCDSPGRSQWPHSVVGSGEKRWLLSL